MTTSYLKFAAAATMLVSASTAFAQSGNGSDVTGPPGITAAGGAFTPLPTSGGAGGAGGAAAVGAAGSASVGVQASLFSSGAPVNSPATGQPIAPAAVATVGSLISGGSPASVASVGAALTSGGASSAAVANLTQALAALAGVSSSAAPAAIINAANAFNALLASAPASFFAANGGQPPAAFLAIHAALTPMIAAINH